MMNETKQAVQKEKATAIESVYDFVEVAVFALVMVAVLFAFFIRIVGVDGTSMLDTLQHGDRLLLTKAFYTPERGDIIVVNRDNNTPVIKRVIAVEGDRVRIDPLKACVVLNGEELNEESYIHYPTYPEGLNEEVVIPEGCVFVLGDHRNNSHDSRKPDLRFISREDIVGKAVFRFYPLDTIGGIYDNYQVN